MTSVSVRNLAALPLDFAAAAPSAAAVWVGALAFVAVVSPVGLAVFLLGILLGAGFSTPDASMAPELISSRQVRPENHNPDAFKVHTPLVSVRENGGESYYYAGQSFSKSLLVILIKNRFKVTDLIALAAACAFIKFGADPLNTSSAKLLLDIIVGNFATYLWLNTVHWMKTTRPRPGKTHADARRRECLGKKPFLLDILTIVRNSDNQGSRSWAPKQQQQHCPTTDGGENKEKTQGGVIPISEFTEEVLSRGLTTTGMDYAPFVFDILTWAVEHKIRSVGRMICHDFGFGSSHGGEPELASHNVYLAIINTSLACWLDATTSQVVFHDSLLPFNSTDLKLWAKITLDVDMVHQTVGVLAMEPYNHGEDVVEVLTTDNLAEISAVLDHLISFKAHPNVHYWANSVQEVTEAEWKHSTTSHHVTQGFNNGAIFSTPEVMGHATSSQWFATAIGHGVQGGIPVHNQLKVMSHQSVAHRMVTDARAKLAEIRPDMHRMKREAIIQATIMHAADHHYAAKYLPACGNSEVLNTSISVVLCALTRPFDYKCRPSLMVKHHVKTDDICAALYSACAKHDVDFAESSLTLGVLV